MRYSASRKYYLIILILLLLVLFIPLSRLTGVNWTLAAEWLTSPGNLTNEIIPLPSTKPVTKQIAGRETLSPLTLIRFHVVANSDRPEDQALKLLVRNDIISYLTPELQKARNLNEARTILTTQLPQVEKIATRRITLEGQRYPVRAQLGRYEFPVKAYGTLVLPSGRYEAVRVVIGQGEGANWWCVLFPPLCIAPVHITPARFNAPQTSTIKDRVSAKGFKSKQVKSDEKKLPVEIRFKLLELIRKKG